MVRPERLVPAGAPLYGGEAAGTIEATVTSLVFQGPVVRCQVRTRTGADLVAHLGPEDDPASIAVGSPITMTWAYDGAYLVPEAIDADMAGVTESAAEQTTALQRRRILTAPEQHPFPTIPSRHHRTGDKTWRIESPDDSS